MLLFAGILTLAIGLAHSYLGEHYILIRLLKRDNLPKVFGSEWFTKQTLRFAWHITSIAWLGFGAILLHLALATEISRSVLLWFVAAVFLISGLLSLIFVKGKHLSWLFFWVIAATTFYSATSG